MAVLPVYSQAYGHPTRKATFLPGRLRVRYLFIFAIVLSVWYFIFLKSEDLPDMSRYTSMELPKPLHAVHEAFEDTMAAVDPFWSAKGSKAEKPPNPIDQKKAEELKAAVLLNTHPDEVAAPPGTVAEVEPLAGAEGDAVAPQEVAAPGSGPSMSENLAEILRVHDSSDTIDQLQNRPIDDALLESLKKIEDASVDGTESSSPEVKEDVTKAADSIPVPVTNGAFRPAQDDAVAAAEVVAPVPVSAAVGVSKPAQDDAVAASEEVDSVEEAGTGTTADLSPIPPVLDDYSAPQPDRPLPAFMQSTSTGPFVPEIGGPWDDISFLFAFGDSWSYTAFDVQGPPPSPQNPLGNPALPVNGTSHPPSWLHYLTTTYNTTYLRTYNIARGAATIDRDVVPPHPGFSYTWTFKEQAADVFGLAYSGHPLTAPWTKDNALFAVWFGVVDIALLLEREAYTTAINEANIAAYANNLDILYTFGARQFLLLTVPPMHLMPGAQHTSISQPAVADFNSRLRSLQTTFLAAHTDATLYLYDLNALLTSIIADPTTTYQTSGLKNTTENCWNYNPDANEEGMAWDRWDPKDCGVRYDEYFWANPLHPTYPVHDAIAAGIVGDCMGPGGRKGFCT